MGCIVYSPRPYDVLAYGDELIALREWTMGNGDSSFLVTVCASSLPPSRVQLVNYPPSHLILHLPHEQATDMQVCTGVKKRSLQYGIAQKAIGSSSSKQHCAVCHHQPAATDLADPITSQSEVVHRHHTRHIHLHIFS